VTHGSARKVGTARARPHAHAAAGAAIGALVGLSAAGAQTLDLTPADRPSLGPRSVLVIETVPLGNEAVQIEAAIAQTATEAGLARALAQDARVEWRRLAAMLGSMGERNDAAAVLALTAARATLDADRLFERAAEAAEAAAGGDAERRAVERGVPVVRGDIAARLASAQSAERLRRFINTAAVARQRHRAGDTEAALETARRAFGFLGDLAAELTPEGEPRSPVLLAPPDIQRVRTLSAALRGKIDDDTLDYIDVLAAMVRDIGQFPERNRLAHKRIEDMESALELDGLVRSTRWVGRRQLLHLRAAFRGAVLATEHEAEGAAAEPRKPGAAFERIALLAQTARVIRLVEDVRRERTNTADAGELLRELLDALAAGLSAGEPPERFSETLDVLELVFEDIRERLRFVELREVDRDLRGAWRVVDERSREAERRAMTALAEVVAQRPPLVGPAGVSLVATLDERVDDQRRLLRAAELATELRDSENEAERAVGDRLRLIMRAASEASKDEMGGVAAMDDALGELRTFVAHFDGLPAEEKARALRGLSDDAFARAIQPGNPRGVPGELRRELARAIERDRAAWLEAFADIERPARRAPAVERLRAHKRVLDLLQSRLVLTAPGAAERLTSLAAVELEPGELASLLRSSGAALTRAAVHASRGEATEAMRALDAASRAEAPIDAFAAAVRALPALPSAGEDDDERSLADVLDELSGDATGVPRRAGVDDDELTRSLARLSRWTAERAAVARSVDPDPLGEIDAYLQRESEALLDLLGVEGGR
jgi:hypothetical protein